MRATSLVVLFALGVVLGGCGKEIGRIPLRAEGSGQASVQTTAGKKLALWTSLDAKWEGQLRARYDVELLEGGAVTGTATCDPFDVNVKTSSKEIRIGDSRILSYNGKMKCELAPTKTGAAVVRAKLSLAGHLPSARISDMSLVVKE